MDIGMDLGRSAGLGEAARCAERPPGVWAWRVVSRTSFVPGAMPSVTSRSQPAWSQMNGRTPHAKKTSSRTTPNSADAMPNVSLSREYAACPRYDDDDEVSRPFALLRPRPRRLGPCAFANLSLLTIASSLAGTFVSAVRLRCRTSKYACRPTIQGRQVRVRRVRKHHGAPMGPCESRRDNTDLEGCA